MAFRDNQIPFLFHLQTGLHDESLVRKLVGCLVLVGLVSLQGLAQESPERPRRGGGFGGPIELGPDDIAFYDAPPEGFKSARENIPHGKLELIEYPSKTVGTTRKANVYTPPGYSSEKKYPVLYLLMASGVTKPSGFGLRILNTYSTI